MNDTATATFGRGSDPSAAERDRAASARADGARAAADRHSRRVRFFKIALPLFGVAALVLVAGLTVARMWWHSPLDVGKVLFSKDGLTMVEPRLSGRSQGRTYDVAAARAFQSIDDPKRIRMEEIDGRLILSDGTSVKLDAASGLYDGTRETLHVEGNVVLVSSNGWRAEGTAADVDLDSGRVHAAAGVRITGPQTLLVADTLDLTDNGHHAVFDGNVHMTLTPHGAAGSADPATAPAATNSPAAPAPAAPATDVSP